MNRTEIKDRITNGINDSGPTLFTTTQLNDLIDEAAEFICAETRSIRRSAQVPLRAGACFYTLPSIADDVMLIYRIWNETQDERLMASSFDELDRFHERWIQTQQNPEIWFPVSWDMFGVWPVVASAGGILRVDYIAWPGPLYQDDEEPELTQTAQDAIVLYGQYMGILKGWDGERAKQHFQALRENESVAKAKSGIHRISHRSFRRQDLEFPTRILERE